MQRDLDLRPARPLFKRERLDSFSDALFAFAMTLLITEVEIPKRVAGMSSAGLAEAVGALWPQFVYFALAFLSIGCSWVGYRLMLHWVVAMDRTFVWISLLYFMGVTAVPFLTGLMGEHGGLALPRALYGFHFALLILLLFALWTYATRGSRLVGADLGNDTRRILSRRLLLLAAVYGGAGALAFLSPWLSTGIYFLVPLTFAVPGAFGRGMIGLPAAEDSAEERGRS